MRKVSCRFQARPCRLCSSQLRVVLDSKVLRSPLPALHLLVPRSIADVGFVAWNNYKLFTFLISGRLAARRLHGRVICAIRHGLRAKKPASAVARPLRRP